MNSKNFTYYKYEENKNNFRIISKNDYEKLKTKQKEKCSVATVGDILKYDNGDLKNFPQYQLFSCDPQKENSHFTKKIDGKMEFIFHDDYYKIKHNIRSAVMQTTIGDILKHGSYDLKQRAKEQWFTGDICLVDKVRESYIFLTFDEASRCWVHPPGSKTIRLQWYAHSTRTM